MIAVFFAVALLSAAVIGYEILLTRLLSIIQWHHFAYMIIGLALLGYGAAGSFIAIARDWLLSRFTEAFAAGAAAFGVTSLACFALAERVPFNALEVAWDSTQLGYLLAIYLLLTVPFFCAACAVGLAFARFREDIGRLYRFDLLGAGAGAAALVGLLFLLPALDALRALGALGFVAAAVAILHGERMANRRVLGAAIILAGLALALATPDGWLAMRLSPYKGLSLALNAPGAAIIAERSSPLGHLTVVESPTIPFRHAPGLSLMARQGPPEQIGVFTDGDSLTAITRFEGERDRLAYLDFQTAALPYHLIESPKVLILGAGGGADVLLARYHGARSIDAVELNPQMAALVARDFADFAGHIYGADGARVHIAEARNYVARTTELYDLIQLALLDSFSAASAGVYALNESSLYTVEALDAYLDHLRPGGVLAITRWLKIPPRDSLKLLATASDALARRGVTDAADRIALIRGWRTTTLLIKDGAFSAADIAAIRGFAERRAFDLAYHPGMSAADANRFNLLEAPDFFIGATTLLGDNREAYLGAYKFALSPATDDRPYFFHFFKWRALPEIVSLAARGGLPLMEWGYVILVATLVQAVLASILLILLPLWLGRIGRRVGSTGWPRGHVAIYFLALGLAFLSIEIAFIQRFVLFLGHPLYAIAVVLSAFLVFAGLGSGVSARLARGLRAAWGPIGGRAPVALAVAGIAAIAALYLAILPSIFATALAWPDAARIALSVGLIAPLAFLMGMPFPLGLTRVAAEAPALVPWAWGINGCASVVSAALATVLAIHFGFTAVVAGSLGLYVVAATFFVIRAEGDRMPGQGARAEQEA